MSQYRRTTIIDKLFTGGVLIKGVSGLVELVVALLLTFVQPDSVRHVMAFATRHELVQDHHIVASLLIRLLAHIDVGGKWFAVIYLAIHGLIKLIAVIGILKNWPWAYPFSLFTLGILALYQVYSIYIHPTAGLIALTIFDLVILWLIWREYQNKRLFSQ